MQHSLKLLILVTTTALPAVTFAQLTGFSSALPLPAEALVPTYAAAFAVLLTLLDYTRAPRTLRLPSPVLVPVAEAFATGSVHVERVAPRRSLRTPQCL